jgi:hypothetical protein
MPELADLSHQLRIVFRARASTNATLLAGTFQASDGALGDAYSFLFCDSRQDANDGFPAPGSKSVSRRWQTT